MTSSAFDLPDLVVLQPEVYQDERGYFFESFNQAKFEQEIGRKVHFVQDNQSFSRKNTLRGLHYQQEKTQSKLVQVLQGEVFDVAVDIRQNSPTFGRWASHILSSDNKKQLWIPEGFAHGFLVLSESAIISYKVSDYYHPTGEKSIFWDDETLRIQWPLQDNKPIISARDKKARSFLMAEYF